MKKFFIIAALMLTQNAQAADEVPSVQTAEVVADESSIYDRIAADALRDPYAESPNQPTVLKAKRIEQEEYIEPEAAEFMKPNRLLNPRDGNLRIQQD